MEFNSNIEKKLLIKGVDLVLEEINTLKNAVITLKLDKDLSDGVIDYLNLYEKNMIRIRYGARETDKDE